MQRPTHLLLILALSAGAMAQAAPGSNPRDAPGPWDAVKALPSGAWVEALPQDQAGPDACRISSVDDAALTCVAGDWINGVRLIFPRSALCDLWVLEPARDRHIARWIVIGAGVALGITLCVEAGLAGAAIVGSVLIALETPDMGPPRPIRPPRPPRLRRRLIYRAP